MTPLIGFVIASVTFMQLLRYGQERKADIYAAVAINYVVACLTSGGLVLTGATGVDTTDGFTVIAFGAVIGILFFSHVPFVMSAYRATGVGITASVNRSSIAVPAILAWALWSEEMSPCRWVALALLPLGMFLLRPVDRGVRHHGLRADVALLGCFAVAASIFTGHKMAHVYFTAGQREGRGIVAGT